jgi:hypothetical protein
MQVNFPNGYFEFPVDNFTGMWKWFTEVFVKMQQQGNQVLI